MCDEAKQLGISVDALIERFIDERTALTHPGRPNWEEGRSFRSGT